MVHIEVFPFKNNKEKFQLMKKLDRSQKCNIEIFENYIVVEVSQYSRA